MRRVQMHERWTRLEYMVYLCVYVLLRPSEYNLYFDCFIRILCLNHPSPSFFSHTTPAAVFFSLHSDLPSERVYQHTASQNHSPEQGKQTDTQRYTQSIGPVFDPFFPFVLRPWIFLAFLASLPPLKGSFLLCLCEALTLTSIVSLFPLLLLPESKSNRNNSHTHLLLGFCKDCTLLLFLLL